MKKNYLFLCYWVLFLVQAFPATDSVEIENIDPPFIIDIIRSIMGVGNGIENFILFIGRFHPLVLHLPIGIITAIFFLEIFIYFYRGNKEHIIPFKKVSLLLCLIGGVTGIIASTLGWMTASSLEYDIDALEFHGYICTIFSLLFFLLAYLRYKEIKISSYKKYFRGVLVINLILLSLGGHEGGNLTHGEEYLFQYAPDFVRVASGRAPKPIKQKGSKNSEVFDDIIMSIMNSRCLYCHNSKKKKGGLRLDSYQAMMQGGEIEGPVFEVKNPENSPIYYRLTINPDDDPDDEFMPPKGKPQLTKGQINLIYWWIKVGAPSKGKIKDFNPSSKILQTIQKQDIVLEPILEKDKKK